MKDLSKIRMIRQLKTTADSVLEKECVSLPKSIISPVNTVTRKGKPVANTFGEGFFWTEIVDAAADTYRGVSSSRAYCCS